MRIYVPCGPVGNDRSHAAPDAASQGLRDGVPASASRGRGVVMTRPAHADLNARALGPHAVGSDVSMTLAGVPMVRDGGQDAGGSTVRGHGRFASHRLGRHRRDPVIPQGAPVPAFDPASPGPAGVPVKQRGAKRSRGMSLLLVAIDLVLAMMVIVVPWVDLRVQLVMKSYSLPGLAAQTIRLIAMVVREPATSTTQATIGACFLIVSSQLASVSFLVRDIYYDVSAKSHVHTGYISVATASIISIAAAYLANNATIFGASVSIADLFGHSTLVVLSLSFWIPIAFGASLVALALERALS